MPQTAKLPALPMRRVVISLTDSQLDALDHMGVASNEPRTAMIRQAVDLFISLHAEPAETLADLCELVAALLESDDAVVRMGHADPALSPR